MIPLLNLKRQNNIYSKKILLGIRKNINNADFILGKNVTKIENKINKIIKSKYCVSCSSGTDALLMSLLSINTKPGDIIITSVYSYISTAEVISLIGAIPVFIDVKKDSYNLDPEILEKTITLLKKGSKSPCLPKIIRGKKINSIKAIISVNLFGKPADYSSINYLAKKNNIYVIEDAAQSFGASYKKKKSGILGDIGCFSFYPTKTLGAMGDGGAIVTNKKKLYKNLLSIRVHGQSKENGLFERIGLTGRLDTLQATILLEKIKKTTLELDLRKKVSDFYDKNFISNKKICLMKKDNFSKSANNVYTLKFQNQNIRDKVQKNLLKNKIGCAIYYKKPFHLQKVFNYLKIKSGAFPNAERLSKITLSIPIDPYLNKNEQIKIVRTINNVFKKK